MGQQTISLAGRAAGRSCDEIAVGEYQNGRGNCQARPTRPLGERAAGGVTVPLMGRLPGSKWAWAVLLLTGAPVPSKHLFSPCGLMSLRTAVPHS